MKRLPFRLPDETRIQWSSRRTRDLWQPRIRAVSDAWYEIEKLSVEDGLRPAALAFVRPESLPQFMSRWQAKLDVRVVDRVGCSDGYSTSTAPPTGDQSWAYRVTLARDRAIGIMLVDALINGDDELVGLCLGFPDCCRLFFESVWRDDDWFDPTWPMAGGRDGLTEVHRGDDCWHTNVLLRWLGLRPVPHLPCSFDCDRSRQLALRLTRLGIAHGYGQEMEWLAEALRWPLEWSALHGVAEIVTPVVKIITTTPATAGRLTVRLAGRSEALEAPAGTRFPHQANLAPASLKATGNAEARPGEKNALWGQPGTLRGKPAPTSNGFYDRAVMDAAHETLLRAVREAGPPHAGTVVDLGCGDGTLLRKVRDLGGNGVRLWGCDLDPERVVQAARLSPDGSWIAGDIFEVEQPPEAALTILMPGRLLETDDAHRRRLLGSLRGRCCLFYLYSDWRRNAGLKEVCADAGLGWWPLTRIQRSDFAEAVVGVVE